MTDEQIKQLANFVYDSIRCKRWLYWPPGPMMGQVFDLENCKKDLKEFISKLESK